MHVNSHHFSSIHNTKCIYLKNRIKQSRQILTYLLYSMSWFCKTPKCKTSRTVLLLSIISSVIPVLITFCMLSLKWLFSSWLYLASLIYGLCLLQWLVTFTRQHWTYRSMPLKIFSFVLKVCVSNFVMGTSW